MARSPVDETRAWTSLSLNLLVLPGLGSWLVGRRIAGAAQAVLAGTGAALSLWWLFLLARQWTDSGYFPWDGGDDFPIGLTGAGLFAVAWIWALATSLSVVRAVRKTSHESRS